MEYKKVITSVLMLAVVAFASPVFAEEGRVGMYGKASTTDRREKMKTNIEERKVSSTERRIEFQQGIAKRKAEHTARVLTATVERLEKIIIRLESRITKVETAGGTITQARIFVTEAREHLSLARSSITLFASLDLSGDKVQENFERIRTLASEAKDHIRETHRSLMNAVRTLKGASTGE